MLGDAVSGLRDVCVCLIVNGIEFCQIFFTYIYWGDCIIFFSSGFLLSDFSVSDGKASVYSGGDPGSIPGLGRSGEGNGNPL